MRGLQCQQRRGGRKVYVASSKVRVLRRRTWSCLFISILCVAPVHSANPPPPVLDGSTAEYGEIPKVPAGMPVFPTQDPLDLSPEQLVRASLPWQGQDTPWRQPGGAGAVGNAWRLSKFARQNFARREPWDVDADINQDAPFDNAQDAPVAGHPPPYYIGDGDFDQNKKMNDPTWTRIIHAPPLLPNGPAQYGHGYKPPGYYPHPFARLGTEGGENQAFLELGSHVKRRLLRGSRAQGRGRLHGGSSWLGQEQMVRRLESGATAAIRFTAAPAMSLLQTSAGGDDDDEPINAVYRDGFPGVVGAPAEFDPSNPKMTTPDEGPSSPKRAPVQDLYYQNYDSTMMHLFMGNAGDPHDMMMPPVKAITGGPFRYTADPKGLAVALFSNDKTSLGSADDPLPVAAYPDDMPPAYAAGGLYPPKPPKPMFGGDDDGDAFLGLGSLQPSGMPAGAGGPGRQPQLSSTYSGGPAPSYFGAVTSPAYAPM